MKPKIELLIECGLTYQPLSVAISLLQEKYEIAKVHILSTHSAIEGASKVIETFFPNTLYAVYGELVDAAGSECDQAEFVANINLAKSRLTQSAKAIIASGTNWMTWHFANSLKEYDTYIVKTAKAFEEKSFFPHKEALAISECGIIQENEPSERIVYLQKLYHTPSKAKLQIKDKVVKFLSYDIDLSIQLAAMYAYLLTHGGVLDLEIDHTNSYNKFCANSEAYNSERAFVDFFSARFRPNVSKINAIFEDSHELVQKHLTVERDGNRYFIASYELVC